MIEKLDIKNGGVEDLLNCIKKINELVDAVNELLKNATVSKMEKVETPAENVQPDTESRPENVQDKFAEQKKWIGKLCV